MPRFEIRHPDKPEIVIGHYAFSDMPGCPRVGISHGLYINPEFRGNKLSQRTQDERDQKARECGYRVILSTTTVGNTPQEKRQEFNGSKCVSSFSNFETDHDVKLYVRHLYDWRQNL